MLGRVIASWFGHRDTIMSHQCRHAASSLRTAPASSAVTDEAQSHRPATHDMSGALSLEQAARGDMKVVEASRARASEHYPTLWFVGANPSWSTRVQPLGLLLLYPGSAIASTLQSVAVVGCSSVHSPSVRPSVMPIPIISLGQDSPCAHTTSCIVPRAQDRERGERERERERARAPETAMGEPIS